MDTRRTSHAWVEGKLAVPGVAVASETLAGTGLTVVLLPPGATGAADVRGGAPATRELDLLAPQNRVAGPDAVLLTGGSAYGLAAADGVMQALYRAGRGVAANRTRVPIVPAMAIFDIPGPVPRAPAAADGEQAVERALRGGQEPGEGLVGAGAGATVGKLGGGEPMPGGQGVVTLSAGGVTVAAVMVVNAAGSVVEVDGTTVAGPRPAPDLPPLSAWDSWWRPLPTGLGPREATTIGVVVVGGRLDKAELQRVAAMAHTGLARAIVPVHTPWDGDAIVACATGGDPVSVERAGLLAAEATARAIRRAVRVAAAATGCPPASRDG